MCRIARIDVILHTLESSLSPPAASLGVMNFSCCHSAPVTDHAPGCLAERIFPARPASSAVKVETITTRIKKEILSTVLQVHFLAPPSSLPSFCVHTSRPVPGRSDARSDTVTMTNMLPFH